MVPLPAPRPVPLALAVLLVLCAGCGDGSEPAPAADGSGPRAGGTFRLAQIAPSGLDPARVYDSYDASLVNQIYDGLLQHDLNFMVRPDVARTWRISDDGLCYRFELERGVLFHDGSEVTAHDVAFSIERVFRLDREATTLAREYLGVIAGADAFARGEADSIAGIRVLADHRLEIRLERPYAAFLNVLASETARIVPRAYVLAHGDDILETAPIGCGPFRLARWERGEKLVLERFEDYHGGPAPLERLEIRTPGDPVLPRALEGFLARELHAIELTTGGRDAITAVQGAEIHRRRELSLTFLGFDAGGGALEDPRLRRALAHAIDVTALPGVDSPSRAPATGVLPPGFPGFTPEPKRLPHDPERARRLLADSGHPEGAGLAPLVIAIPRRSASVETLVDGLCRQLGRLGVEVEPRFLEWEEFDRGLRENAFDAFLITWLADLPDPDSFFYPLLHSRGSVNHFHFASDAVDHALVKARTENDRGRRIELYREIERTVLAQGVLVPIHFSSTVFAVQPEVRGFRLSSMGGGNLRLEQVWLEAVDPTPGDAKALADAEVSR